MFAAAADAPAEVASSPLAIALGLAAVVLLVLGTGYFVAAEFAWVSVKRGRLEELASAGDRRADIAIRVHKRLSFMLSGAQLGITATSLLIGYIAEPTLGAAIAPLVGAVGVPERAVGGVALGLALLLATAAQMIFSELVPKNLAIARPEQTAQLLARSVLLFTNGAAPLIRLFDSTSNRLLRLFGIEAVEELAGGASPEELELIIAESGSQGTLSQSEAGLLARALGFRSLRAGEVLVPRHRMVTVEADATAADVRALLASGHSRFPVVGEGADDVIGVVSAKDLLRVDRALWATTPVRQLAQPMLVVPESALLGPLLSEMRAAHSQMALVVDEHGGVAGLATLEDVVEELVGDIRDEYDPVEQGARRRPDGALVVPGSWRLHELARELDVALPPGDYDTVAGLVLDRLNRLAEVGDEVLVTTADLPHRRVRLRVERLDGFTVDQIALLAEDREGRA